MLEKYFVNKYNKRTLIHNINVNHVATFVQYIFSSSVTNLVYVTLVEEEGYLYKMGNVQCAMGQPHIVWTSAKGAVTLP